MGTEIERKFLVTSDEWRADAKATVIRQGYLCRGTGSVVRVRTCGDAAFVTIKGDSSGISRLEFEYSIPTDDANLLLDTLCTLCRSSLIEKTRYEIIVDELAWIIDVFAGANDGLVVAELELDSEDQAFTAPSWLGGEVSTEARYFNVALSERPFSAWSAEERNVHDRLRRHP